MRSPRIPASIYLVCFFLFTFLLLHAAPYGPDGLPVEFIQPDGTKLNLRVFGDEFYGHTRTEDGYTVFFNAAANRYEYATLSADGNDLAPTGKEVGKVDPKSLGLAKGLDINPAAKAAKARANHAAHEAAVKQGERWEAVKQANRNYRAFKNEVKKQEKAGKKGFVIPLGTVFPDSVIPPAPQMEAPVEGDGKTTGEPPIEQAPPSFTLTGDVVGLTILVDFSDVPGTVVTQAQVDDYFNKPGYTGFSQAGSVYDYFFIQSGGKLRYNNNVTYYVRVPQPKTYYNVTTTDSGLCGRSLLNDALNVLIANGYDFSKLTTKLESGQNRVRACNVFFAGADSGVWAKGLWPHRWVLSPAKSVGGGKYIYDYQITDIGTTADLAIGTVCHENGHMLLGYPDLYSYDGNAANMGNYSLMAGGNYGGGGKHPTNIDPYLKEASGWMDVIDLNSASQQRCTVQVDGNQVYRYANPAKLNEYFMFEVRDNTGWEGPYGGQTGSVNPGTGIVAYHVNETGSNTYSTIFTPSATDGSVPAGKVVRDFTKPYELLLLEASPKALNAFQTYWYEDPTPDTADAFRLSTGKTQLSDTTTPDLKFWVATATNGGRLTNSGANINNISADSNVMTFVAGAGTPSATPGLMLSRSTINSYSNFGVNAASQTFTICNSQGGTLNYTVSDDQTWLSCTPTTGTATTESDIITINYATSGLAAGTYTGTITVTDPAASPSTKTIAVTLTVTAQPVMALSTTAVSVTGISGFSGSQSSFGVTNTGGGTMNYTVSGTQPWLSVSPASGTVVAETDTIYVNCNATSLAPGTYTDTITVASTQANNSPRTLAVTFTVQGAEMIVSSPNGGEQWAKGENRNITWTSSLGGNVKIELLKGGVLNSTLAATTANTGSFSWAIPGTQAAGTDYTVRLTSIESPTKTDTSNANFAIMPTLADAVDTTGLTWSTTGTPAWYPQTTTTQDGVDAAQSGAIADGLTTSMQTTVTGPGTLTYWWKVSSESNYDWLSLYLNDVLQTGSLARISGEVAWVQKTVSIPTGSQTIKWSYSKDGSVASGSDAAWVDQVVWTPSAAPEIAVEQPVGTNLVDGSATVSCGSAMVGSPATAITFTIKNTGASNLTGLTLGKTGTHAADYALGTLGATTVAPGASTTFTVTFTPGGAGVRTASLQIGSNDSDENPFDISLTGTGVTVGTLAVSPAGGLTSSGTYGGPFTPGSLQYTLSNPGNSTINWTAAKTANWVSLSATTGTLNAGASTTVTVTINSNANSLNVGSYTDTVSFNNTTNSEGNTTRAVSLTVNPFPATVALSNLTYTYDGTAKSATVTTTPAGLPCTVTYAGSASLPIVAGSYPVVATISDSNYTGSASGTLVINKASQTITFNPLATVLDNAAPFNLTATASSGLTVSYTSSNPAVATVSGEEVTVVGVGSTTITASQPGDQDYNAAVSVPQTLTVVRANPLAVTTGPYKILFGQSLALDGSASQPSNGQTITAYAWDLNNDGTFGDVTGAIPTPISYATLTTTWGLHEGVNTIQLRVTDSSSPTPKTHTVATTVEIVVGLTWDANGTTANRTDGAGIWLDANKWWDGAANTGWASGSSANFGNGGTGGAVTLASATTLNTLIFNPYGGTYTLGTAGSTITINGGIIKNSGSGAATFVSPITLGGPQTWANHSTTALTTANGTNLIDNAGHQLTIDGTGITNLGVVSNAAVALTGSGALVKNGSGRLSVGGVNTGFTGNSAINGGVLHAHNSTSVLGDGNLTLNGGVLSFYWGVTYARTLGTGTNQVQIPGGESGFGGSGATGPSVNLGSVVWGSADFNPSKFILGDPGTGNAAVITFSSAIDLNGATRTIVVPAGLNAGLNRSTLSGLISNGSGTGGLVKEGGGWLFLTTAPTYNGATTVSEGFLDLAALNLNSMGGGAGVRSITVAAGATVRRNALDNAFLNRLVETTNEIGVMTGTTANNLDFSSSTGANLPNAYLGCWASNGAKSEYSGTLTPASDAYRLGGKGSSGLLGIVGTNKLTGARGLFVGTTTGGGRVELAGANDFSGNTVIRTGARLTLGNNLALQNSTLDLGSAGGTFSLSDGLNAARITGGVAAPSPTFGGLIGSRNLLTAFSGASGGNNESVLTATGVTGFTLNLADGKSCTYSGAIADFATGTTLTKTGLGTQILTGANTYTGTTTVSAGKLIINGSLSNVAAALNVAAGATLGGTGTIGRNVTIADGGKLEFDISTAAGSHNSLDISTGRDFAFSGTSTLVITSSSGASAGLYTLVTGGNAISYSSLPTLSLPNGWAATVQISGNSLQLNVTSVAGVPVAMTYAANGATSGTAPVDGSSPYTSGATVTVLGNGSLTKTGHSFAGWNTAANGSGTPRSPGSTFTINADTTLYAQWTANTYTVTFDPNGGNPPSPGTKSVTYGSTYGALPTPTRTGYTFNGWFTAASGGTLVDSATTVSITANQTLYAQWTANTYTVTFNSNGGGTPSPTSSVVTYGSTYGALATVSRTGYSFNGWFTAASGGTQVTSSTTVNITANQTLYAQWTALTYTVTFNPNGGDVPVPSSKSVTYDAAYGTLATVTRTGYLFNGWFTAASGGIQVLTTTTVAITANQTLYAQWTADTYTVTFDPNGGDVPTPTSKSVTYGATYGTLATTSRTGHTFNGWFTAATGGTQVTSGTTVSITDDQILYAQWTPLEPEIDITRGGAVADGGYHAVTGTTSGTGTPLTFAIANNGQNTLTLGSAVKSAESNCTVVINTQPATSIAAAGSSNLAVTVTPTTSGAWSFDLSLSNNDSNENPYNWTVHGVTGGVTTTSIVATDDCYIASNEATLTHNGTSIALNSNTQQGQTRHGLVYFDISSISANATISSATLNFFSAGNGQTGTVDIYNTAGTPPRAWTGAAAIWNNSSAYIGSTKYGGAASTSTATVGTAIPTITLDANGLALVQGWVASPTNNTGFSIKTSYNNNKAANSVQLCSADHGTAGYRPKLNLTYVVGVPEMRVVRADAVLADGGTDTVSGTVPGVGAQLTYKIANLGNANLTLTTPVTATATSNCTIAVNTQPTSPVLASTDTTMLVTVTPAAAGSWSATLSIANNDSDENPYNWTISGTTAGSATAVTFDKQGGTGGDNGVAATNGLPMPAATAPARTGYTFGGYYASAGGTGNQYYTAAMASARNWDSAAATATLYAKWTANAYTVSFDKQGGTGGSISVSATYGSAMPAATAPTRTGYTFDGYYTAPNGGGVAYYTAAMASAMNWSIAANTTLYAKWIGNSYSVTLDAQGGSGGSTSVSAVYESAMPAATAPTRTGYTFGGYYTAINGGGSQYYTETMASARTWDLLANTTLYARWILNTYTLTYSAGSGGSLSGTPVQAVNHGASGTQVTAVPNAGYYFVKWSDDVMTASRTDSNVTSALSVTANFAQITYTSWANATFANGTLTNTDLSQDVDGDGLPTGVEWAVGGDPTLRSDADSKKPVLDNTSDPDYVIYSYRRSDLANADPKTSIIMEYGSGLTGWTAAEHDGDDIIILTTNDGYEPGIDRVDVKIKRSTKAPGGKIFTRLRVVVVP